MRIRVEELPDYFVTSMSLSAEDHIRAQAAIQRWVDSSISKTANCPADFTVEETERLYELAFDLGCKGVTIYRDGSRDVQVLSTREGGRRQRRLECGYSLLEARVQAEAVKASIDELSDNAAVVSDAGQQDTRISVNGSSFDKQYKSRPQVLRGATYKVNTPFGMAYITINDMNGITG